MRRASRNHGIRGRLRLPGSGNAARSASVIPGCSRGASRKYPAQSRSQSRLTNPRITKERRQDTNKRSAAISGGVAAFPIRPNEWAIPCAKPQSLTGTQVDIARVAVGKAAPCAKPKASRKAKSETNPLAAPVSMVVRPTIAQHADNVRRGPNLSPIQPPMS